MAPSPKRARLRALSGPQFTPRMCRAASGYASVMPGCKIGNGYLPTLRRRDCGHRQSFAMRLACFRNTVTAVLAARERTVLAFFESHHWSASGKSYNGSARRSAARALNGEVVMRECGSKDQRKTHSGERETRRLEQCSMPANQPPALTSIA
jgi:hypothetical protein